MREIVSRITGQHYPARKKVLSCLALSVLAASCYSIEDSPAGSASAESSAETPADHSSPVVEERERDFVITTLNFDNLNADNKCAGGAERPCFGVIRTTPQIIPEKVDSPENYLNPGTFNPDGGYAEVTWPFEAGNGQRADELKVTCRVRGEEYNGTDIWDVVEVPAELSVSGQTEYGYITERFMDMPEGIRIACEPGENPAAAEIVDEPTQ